jgi:hypothetical protein
MYEIKIYFTLIIQAVPQASLRFARALCENLAEYLQQTHTSLVTSFNYKYITTKKQANFYKLVLLYHIL